MTTIDRVTTRTASVDWRRVALVALMVVPYVLGYSVRSVVRAIGWLFAWSWAAAVEGWTSAGPTKGDGGPQ